MGSVIQVELPRTTYYTGEVLEGTLVLALDSPEKARGLHIEFIGRETTENTRGSGEHRHTYRSTHDHVAWALPLLGEGAIAPGAYRFPFRFQIPAEAVPSYVGRHANVKYTLTARLDIPLWPDTTWSTEIFVYYDRNSVRQFAKPARFLSSGPTHEFLVELDGDRFFAREMIACQITLLRLNDVQPRQIYVRFTGGEWAQAQHAEETTQTFSQEMALPMESLPLGAPCAFEIPIPGEVQSSYRGRYSYYTYMISVGLDVPWARDIVAQTPIVVVR